MMLQFNDDGVLEKVDKEKLVTVDETELQEHIDRHNELQQFKDKVFEVIDNHILEETDLRKECIENGSHYTANISRNIIDTLKLIKKELEE